MFDSHSVSFLADLNKDFLTWFWVFLYPWSPSQNCLVLWQSEMKPCGAIILQNCPRASSVGNSWVIFKGFVSLVFLLPSGFLLDSPQFSLYMDCVIIWLIATSLQRGRGYYILGAQASGMDKLVTSKCLKSKCVNELKKERNETIKKSVG